MAKIGLNSMTFNNDINILKNLKKDIDTYECTKPFLLQNYLKLLDIGIECQTFSSLIVNEYDLTNKSDRCRFLKEFKETCILANDLGCSKLMFGMERFRKVINDDILKFFVELLDVAKDYNMKLLYEAISNSKFLPNHKELIKFTKEHNLDGIHVDFGTLINENESLEDLAKETNILNIHAPFGLIIKNIPFDISYENYTKKSLTEKEIKEFLDQIKCGK